MKISTNWKYRMAQGFAAILISCLIAVSFPLAASGASGAWAAMDASAGPGQVKAADSKPKPKPTPEPGTTKTKAKSSSSDKNLSSSSNSSSSSSERVKAPPSSPKPENKPAPRTESKPASKPASEPKAVTTSRSENKPRTYKPDTTKRSSKPTISTPKPQSEAVIGETIPSVRERKPDPPPPREPRRDRIVEDPDSEFRPPAKPDDPDALTRRGLGDRAYPRDDPYEFIELECTLEINSSPSGADVYFDQFYLGRTPLISADMQPGAGMLRLELEGYRTIERYISIRRKQTNRISFTLEPLPGTFSSLYVTSDPPGASLTVNGRERGTTPTSVLDVPPGVVHLLLRKEGHLDVERNIELAEGQYRQVEVYLPLAHVKEEPASIRVSSNPPGAEIYLNGSLLGVTPLSRDKVTPGKAVLFARKEGFANARRSLPLSPGQEHDIVFDLQLLSGSLLIRTNPTGATIQLDGSSVGMTNSSGLRLEGIPIGSHHVSASRKGYLNTEQYVTVQPDAVTEVELSLPDVGTLPYDPTAFGELIVESFPSGVEVHLDYNATGQYTPTAFHNLHPGRYLVSAFLDGYGWDERYVVVQAGTRSRVTLNLAQKPYTVGGWNAYHGSRGGYGSMYGPYYGMADGYGTSGGTDPWDDVNRYLIEWDHTFDQGGVEEIADVVALGDSLLLLAGYREEAGVRNGWLLKLDAYGNRVWHRTFTARGWDAFTAIEETRDGGFILAGTTCPDSINEADAWLLLCDSEGKEIWSRTYGGGQWDGATSVTQAKDGGFYFAGETWSEGEGLSDGWLVKTASDGFVEWSRRFGGKGEDRFTSIAQTADGTLLLAGSSRDLVTEQSDGWLVKVTQTGRTHFSRTIGGGFDDGFSSMVLTDDGGLLLAGYTDSEGMLERNAWLVRLNRYGEESWSRTFGGYGAGIAWDVQVSRDGYLLCGTTLKNHLNPQESAWVIRTDFRGEATWYRDFSTTGNSSLRSLALPGKGGFIAVGSTTQPGKQADGWAVRMVPEGETIGEDDVLISPTGLMLRLVDYLIFK